MLKFSCMDIRVDRSKAIVFDLDDTLYNEIEYLKSAYFEIAHHLDPKGWKPLYSRMFSLYRSREDVFAYLSGEYKTDKDLLIQRYREHKPNIHLFPGALSLLQSIKKNNGKVGIITDGRSLTQRNKIRALGIDNVVDHIVVSEEIGTEKPHRRNYEALSENLPAREYVYVGDNLKKDFLTPNQLGWTTIGLIDNGLNIHKDGFRFMKKGYLPHAFVRSLEEIRISG